MTNRILTTGLGAAGIAAFICFGAAHEARAHQDTEAAFVKMDTNGDGKISVEEWTNGHKTMFEKIDTNSDGKVTSDELAIMEEKHEKMGKSDKAGKPAMPASEKLKIFDTNGDGVVTEEEFVSGSKVMFEKIDTNGDGNVTKAELKAGHDKMVSKTQPQQPPQK